jgi:hypothetical protein
MKDYQTGSGTRKVSNLEAESIDSVSAKVEEGVEKRQYEQYVQENLKKWKTVEEVQKGRIFYDPELKRYIEVGLNEFADSLGKPAPTTSGMGAKPADGKSYVMIDGKQVENTLASIVRALVEKGGDSDKIITAIRMLLRDRIEKSKTAGKVSENEKENI